MTLQEQFPAIYELAADLQRRIGEAEMKAHEDVDRLSELDEPRHVIVERWRHLDAEVQPMRQHLASLWKSLALIEVNQPRTFFVSKADGLTFQTAEPGDPLSWSRPSSSNPR